MCFKTDFKSERRCMVECRVQRLGSFRVDEVTVYDTVAVRIVFPCLMLHHLSPSWRHFAPSTPSRSHPSRRVTFRDTFVGLSAVDLAKVEIRCKTMIQICKSRIPKACDKLIKVAFLGIKSRSCVLPFAPRQLCFLWDF